MIESLHPGLLLVFGAALIPFLRGRIKSAYVVGLPAIAFLLLQNLPATASLWEAGFLDFELELGRVDALSRAFGNIFAVVAVIGFVYILHTRDDLEYVSAMIYAGSAIGVVFAGDLLSLFFFWELLTLCAVGLTLARRSESSRKAAMRYLLVHVAGGVVFLAGVVCFYVEQGTFAFGAIGLQGPAGWLIFLGAGVNCAWPLLHAWLPDAYPEASIGGIVFMATFTTKSAVYLLARAFPGETSLIWIGAAMAVFALLYAVIENNLRRVLAYGLINQVGFMVIGVGMGTAFSLNGTVAHAYAHILYKALLFMAVGAVIHRTSREKATDLGGLWRSMPLTCLFYVVGALSSAPLLCGFVSKSLVLSAAAEEHLSAVWLVLLIASAGIFHCVGVKVPYFTFFCRDAGLRVREAPTNMLVAMGMAAALCVSLALPVVNLPWVGYHYLYDLLPHPMEPAYHPYTFPHVVAQLLVLSFALLAFVLMLLGGKYPPEIRAINLDVDWFYRRGGQGFCRIVDGLLNGLNRTARYLVVNTLVGRIARFFRERPSWLLVQAQILAAEFRGEKLPGKRRRLYDAARLGAHPVGLTALFSVVMLAVLFVL